MGVVQEINNELSPYDVSGRTVCRERLAVWVSCVGDRSFFKINLCSLTLVFPHIPYILFQPHTPTRDVSLLNVSQHAGGRSSREEMETQGSVFSSGPLVLTSLVIWTSFVHTKYVPCRTRGPYSTVSPRRGHAHGESSSSASLRVWCKLRNGLDSSAFHCSVLPTPQQTLGRNYR